MSIVDLVPFLFAGVTFVAGLSWGKASARNENEREVLRRIIKRRVDKRVNALYAGAGERIEAELTATVDKLLPPEEGTDPRD